MPAGDPAEAVEARRGAATGGEEALAAAEIETFRTRILEVLRRNYPASDLERTIRALDQAERLHSGQRRRSGEPYLHHPLRIALEAAELGLDPDTAIVALLHDTLEDTEVSMDDLRRDYGDLADVVDGLTKISAGEAQGFERDKAQTYYKILVSSVRDIRTLLVKLLDRLDNMRSLGALRRSKQRRIAQETLDIYVPIAARLGLGEISRELAQLGFQFLYPTRYARTVRTIERGRRGGEERAESLRGRLAAALAAQGLEADVRIRWREVHEYLYAADHVVPSVLAGVTIEVATAIGIYSALGVVHSEFRAVPGRIRDFVSNPKPNGYRAVVTQVNVEGEMLDFEITSREMAVVNERGMLASWAKEPGALSEFYLHYLKLLETLTEDDDLRVEDVRSHALPDTLHVFSPDGDSFSFPRGATCLDFAYRIHSTEVGDRASGARVNGVEVHPGHRMADGDVVSIIVSPDVVPTEQWLEWTVTARAQTAIRRVLKRQRRDRAREVGLELLRLEVSRYGLDPRKTDPGELLAPALASRHLELDELLAQIGFRRLDVTTLVRDLELVGPDGRRLRRAERASLLGRLLGRRSPPRPDFTVHRMNDAFVRMAGCCHPVLGERVVGYLTTDTGISLHHRGCEKLGKLDPAGLLTIDWDPAAVPTTVELHVIADNHPGMITKLAKVISDNRVNIDDMSIAPAGGTGHIRLVLGSVDLGAMRRIAETLRETEGVQKFWQTI